MEQKSKLDTLKSIATVVVSIGVGGIVTAAVNHVMPVDVGTIKKACMTVGGLALANMISDKTTEHTRDSIDKVADEVREMLSVETPEEELLAAEA